MTEEARVNRRGFLRTLAGKGAAAAAGAGAASALLAQPAGAADLGNLVIGAGAPDNTGITTTTLTSTQAASNATFKAVASTASAIGLEATAATGAGVKITPSATLTMPPATGTWTRGSMRTDDALGFSDLWYCYADGAGTASGWFPLSLIPAFIPLAAPQRIYYSATSGTGAPIFNGQERTLSSLVGGFVPATAFAISINLAVISTTGDTGFLAVFGADVPWPGHSNINWFGPGQILANGTVTATDVNGDFKVRCGTNGSTHFVVDVLGFYTLSA